MHDSDAVVERVIAAVSEETGRPESELPPLYDHVDAEAISILFEHAAGRSGADPVVEFEYAGTTVRVSDSGVTVIESVSDGGREFADSPAR